MTGPERIGRYEVVAHLATGGMGQVFLARASGIGGFVRHVVLKTLDLPGTDEDEAIAMFLDEARLLGLLHHQHISPVFEVGKDEDGQLFLVMDYIHGHTAHDVWQRTNQLGAALPIDFSLTVTAAAASGLHYAHTRRDPEGRSLRIVHRDVSLSNLMIGFDGAVKLIDFGIAKAANQSTQTQAGFIKGKLGYMAPEQLRGLAVDARTDVFALGIVLYELTTMRRAFRDESDRTTMDRIRAGTFTAPSAINPEYPRELERIVTRALRVDPRERYSDAEAMRRELDLLGHQLGLVLGDVAILEVMSQLFTQRGEPWQHARQGRAPTELEVSLEVTPPAMPGDDDSRRTVPQLTLRAATQATEAQLVTPPHGVPKRPSAFSIESGAIEHGARQPVANDTDGVMILPPSPEGAAAASAAMGKATDSVPAAPVAAAPVGAVGAIEPPAGAAAPGRSPSAKLPPAPRPRRRLVIGWIAAVLVAGGGAAGSVYLLQRSEDAPPEAEARPIAGAEPGTAGQPGAAPAPSPAPSPSAAQAQRRDGDPEGERDSDRGAAPSKSPIVPPPGAQIQIVVKTTPPDATLMLDGKRLGRTPYSGAVGAAAGTHTLKIRKKGYAPVTIDLELGADFSRDITLQRAKGEPAQ